MKLLYAFILLLSMIYNANAELIKNSKNIIKDTKTNYLWQDTKEVSTGKKTFIDAVNYCRNLELDGETSWEVPGFMELQSIVDVYAYNPAISKKFNFIVPDKYWTSKNFGMKGNKYAYVVNFSTGVFNKERAHYEYYVRCYKKNKKIEK